MIIEVRANAKTNTWTVWTPRTVDYIKSQAAFVADCNRFYGYEKYRLREEDQKPPPKKRAPTKRAPKKKGS